VLSGESPGQRWTGAWREPVPGRGRSTGYGVERFYFSASSDSSRAVPMPTLPTRATFGADTAAAASTDPPGWRHAGIDIPAAPGTPVRAPAGGIVADVGDYTLTGRTLVIDHGQGVHSAYFHLDTILVQKGDAVRPGATVARVGSTGLVTGPHLHYGIYVHGADVDPEAWRDMPPFARGDSAATRSVRDRP
jgi:murein DD-endopeptidase MepM/ murein hydrolase activator NlpD